MLCFSVKGVRKEAFSQGSPFFAKSASSDGCFRPLSSVAPSRVTSASSAYGQVPLGWRTPNARSASQHLMPRFRAPNASGAFSVAVRHNTAMQPCENFIERLLELTLFWGLNQFPWGAFPKTEEVPHAIQNRLV